MLLGLFFYCVVIHNLNPRLCKFFHIFLPLFLRIKSFKIVIFVRRSNWPQGMLGFTWSVMSSLHSFLFNIFFTKKKNKKKRLENIYIFKFYFLYEMVENPVYKHLYVKTISFIVYNVDKTNKQYFLVYKYLQFFCVIVHCRKMLQPKIYLKRFMLLWENDNCFCYRKNVSNKFNNSVRNKHIKLVAFIS